MSLYLSEADVRSLVTVPDAVDALEEAFRHWRLGGTENLPRQRLPLPTGSLNLMAASYPAADVCGHKAYFSGCHFVSLYSISEHRLLALIEAATLGAMRTGAASGVATRYLARPDATRCGIIGTGRQARTQLQAVASVRTIREVSVFGRDAGRRAAFVEEMEATLECPVKAADTMEDCVREADIVIAATKAAEPVILGEWLADGAHVNAIGANAYGRRELDAAAVMRASVVAVDDRDQARVEARELIDLVDGGDLSWDDVVELGALVQAGPVARDAAAVTLFKSLGVALEDIAFARLIHERAVERNIGTAFGT